MLRLIESARFPLSHGDIMRRLRRRAVDRATVFRILDDLVRVGLARRIGVGDRILRYGPPNNPHDGFRAVFACTSCDRVEELEVELTLPDRVPRSLRRRQVQLLIRGRCDSCTKS
ncbi:MAG: transcriptional repressor [Kofleriaceae bacterium]|nr:transcriptional repressor [Kofleriaceae bacterium]